MSFGIGDYLEHHRPRRPRGVTEAPDEGWFTLAGATVRFRIPTVADLLAAASERPAGRRPSPAVASTLPRYRGRSPGAWTARSPALAPSLDDLIGGSCPACGHDGDDALRPARYTLAELRNVFSGIYLETHALAATYGWPEEAILALPRGRRRRYASIIADERSVA